jgi:hypothetical protein
MGSLPLFLTQRIDLYPRSYKPRTKASCVNLIDLHAPKRLQTRAPLDRPPIRVTQSEVLLEPDGSANGLVFCDQCRRIIEKRDRCRLSLAEARDLN